MTGDRLGAVVTGAASGVGHATALRLHHEGYDVLGVDRNKEGLSELEKLGIRTITADLASEHDRDAVVGQGSGASVLVNAAALNMMKPILEVDVNDIREIYAVNVEAIWDLCSRIGRAIPRDGAIVNFSSTAAKNAAMTDAAVYASSKAAILSITRSFAYTFAPNEVRVNAICPGAIDTPMLEWSFSIQAKRQGITLEEFKRNRTSSAPIKRAAQPEEVAGLVWFLVSDAGSFMTGQAINFDGGMLMY